ncbi:putative glycerophosphodiester phosphodiesterase, protein kinase RLK-Pelle-LRK10L-2 family [Helianthus annuus]|nr:putative glycerophosphodiester phosphodiesterase, protein kinase RLK-Pelle-LRK10L-2 family [Helianthus annuus]
MKLKPRLDPSPAIFSITVVLATIIRFPVFWCQETPYDICSQSDSCGNFEFGYPFWGLNRPYYCGRLGFHLTCQLTVPELIIESVNYRVLVYNSRTHTITVARSDLWSNICPQYLHNTTYNSTLFNSDNFGQVNVSLYYRCQENTSVTMDANYRLSCDVNGTRRNDSYFSPNSLSVTNISSFLLMQCNNFITVPVGGAYYDIASESDLRYALQEGFRLEWMANNDECDRCIKSNGQCGSNATSPEQFVCYGSGGVDSKSSSLGIVLASFGAAIAVVVVGFGIFFWKKRSEGPEGANDQIEIFIKNYGSLAPKRYKFSEIKKMTNSFLEKLGNGGYGSVYKGQLPDGRLVAVKLLSEVTGNGEDFINEVASISRTSHVNIVTLLGFCFKGKKRALLYKYMPNGSLDKFLRGDGLRLDWSTLFQIAKGIARGLEYLHKGCNTRIVHFDIKPHNILLDEEFVPKIADFGLAKLCKKKESIVSVMGARGTAGYMAPEVFISSLGGASHKSDVYSYGMMILEMTGARKHTNARRTSASEEYFPDWIYKQVEVGGNLGDNGVTTEVEDELARKMMMVSLWCIQSNPSDRPSISKVVEMLEGSIESLQVPPRRFESSPSRPFQGTPS